jgi:hypothetical protein
MSIITLSTNIAPAHVRGLDRDRSRYLTSELTASEFELWVEFWLLVEECGTCSATLCSYHYDCLYNGVIPKPQPYDMPEGLPTKGEIR